MRYMVWILKHRRRHHPLLRHSYHWHGSRRRAQPARRRRRLRRLRRLRRVCRALGAYHGGGASRDPRRAEAPSAPAPTPAREPGRAQAGLAREPARLGPLGDLAQPLPDEADQQPQRDAAQDHEEQRHLEVGDRPQPRRQRLAREAQAPLALLARRPLPPREEWDAVLRREGGPVAARIRAVRRLEALGVPVVALAAEAAAVPAPAAFPVPGPASVSVSTADPARAARSSSSSS